MKKAKKVEIDVLNIIDAIAREYTNLYCVDIETGDFIPVAGKEYELEAYVGQIEAGMDFESMARDYAEHFVIDYDRPRVLKACKLEYIREELERRSHFSVLFLSENMGLQRYRQMVFSAIESANGKHLFIWAFSDVDERIRTEVEKEKLKEQVNNAKKDAVISKIAGNFDYVGYISTSTNEIRNYVVNGIFAEYIDSNEKTVQPDVFDKILKEIIVPADFDAFRVETERYKSMARLDREGSFDVHYRVVHKEDIHYYRTVFSKDESEGGGVIIGFICEDKQLREIKERERYERTHRKELALAKEKAELANKAKTDFLISLSRDIRTPMQDITGYTEMAQKHGDDNDKLKEYIDKIEKSSKEILERISQIISIENIEEGKPQKTAVFEEYFQRELRIDGLNILLVEDNVINQEIVRELLEEEGATVRVCQNGKEGVEAFDKSELFYYDAILMDITMPVMDGLEATREIRSIDREDASLVPIIAMTANAFLEDVGKSKEAGMNEYVTKPIDMRNLIRIIEENVRKEK